MYGPNDERMYLDDNRKNDFRFIAIRQSVDRVFVMSNTIET